MKRDNYIPLISQLQRMYPEYTYTIIPMIIGALGTVPKRLSENLKKLGLPPKRVTLTINNPNNGNTWQHQHCKNFQSDVNLEWELLVGTF